MQQIVKRIRVKLNTKEPKFKFQQHLNRSHCTVNKESIRLSLVLGENNGFDIALGF